MSSLFVGQFISLWQASSLFFTVLQFSFEVFFNECLITEKNICSSVKFEGWPLVRRLCEVFFKGDFVKPAPISY